MHTAPSDGEGRGPGFSAALSAARDKMEDAGVDPLAIAVFSQHFGQLARGETGLIPEEAIDPFLSPKRVQSAQYPLEAQSEAMRRTAVIKLNGGLGTSMGLEQAKTLLPVRDGKNFLDIIVSQVLAARERFEAPVPLVFMNSYRTDADTLDYLTRYPELSVEGLPLGFLQSQEPRLNAQTLEPIGDPVDAAAQWCPPGHGDLYVSLQSTGVLDGLLQRGFRYVQVSNGDNLGATPDGEIAAWFAQSGSPFAMEVSRRTANDRKGGHLAQRRADGALVLRESAQTPSADREAFEDIDRHRYFNTNTIWLNLELLKETLDARNGVLGLPIIRNLKRVEPDGSSAVEVIQIETAMGAAIEVFPGAQAVEVPRSRFLPVKTTNELLLLRSDLYRLSPDGTLILDAEQTPEIRLNAPFYARIDDFERRIPQPPSLRSAESLIVEGDWYFLPGAQVVGDLTLGIEGGTFGPTSL